ncbi:MAG: DUF1579 domain-containing protein [Planctomycetes bacterium]|nr:DUF1579 domain-containing protein [Planctomycetota bacterium]
MQGRPRHGEELLALHSVTGTYQSAWIDDFHMNYAILFSEGKPTERGFEVRGNYDGGNGHPPWGWRTEYEWIDNDYLIIRAFNIEPEGMESKATELEYRCER